MNASIRYRLFLITACLLYMGPLIAGLAGFGWRMIPVFTLIFLLWLIVMRPGMWPERAADWSTPRVIARALMWAGVQAVLVTFCFAIGRGIGATMGALASVPVWVPPLMSFMAIPLSRIFWNPALASPEMADFLDRATLEMATLAAARHAGPDATQGLSDAAEARARGDCTPFVAELAALPDTAPDAGILAILARAKPLTSPMALLDSLAEPAAPHRANPLLRRAFILLATDADMTGQVLGMGQLSRAFDLAGEDAGRLQLYAERTLAALNLRRIALMDTPPVQRMRDVAKRHPSASAALMALTDQMDRLNDA